MSGHGTPDIGSFPRKFRAAKQPPGKDGTRLDRSRRKGKLTASCLNSLCMSAKVWFTIRWFASSALPRNGRAGQDALRQGLAIAGAFRVNFPVNASPGLRAPSNLP